MHELFPAPGIPSKQSRTGSSSYFWQRGSFRFSCSFRQRSTTLCKKAICSEVGGSGSFLNCFNQSCTQLSFQLMYALLWKARGCKCLFFCDVRFVFLLSEGFDDRELVLMPTAVSGQDVVHRDHKRAVTFRACVTCSALCISCMFSSSEVSSSLSLGCGGIAYVGVAM